MPENAFEPSQVTAAILAGGEGSRMQGRDKGLIELAGRPLIAHVVEALSGQAAAMLICANRHADEYARFATVVADAVPGFRGPLAGIAAALARCTTPWLLTVPVDAPRLPRDLAPRLFSAAQSTAADAAIALEDLRPQPMFALYRNRLAESAATALALDLPVWRWQQQIRAAEVFFDADDNAFVNLNTAEDVEAWERAHAQV